MAIYSAHLRVVGNKSFLRFYEQPDSGDTLDITSWYVFNGNAFPLSTSIEFGVDVSIGSTLAETVDNLLSFYATQGIHAYVAMTGGDFSIHLELIDGFDSFIFYTTSTDAYAAALPDPLYSLGVNINSEVYSFNTGEVYNRVAGITNHLRMVRGNNALWRFAAVQDTTPVVLTGGTLTFSAKWAYTDASPLITFTSAGSQIVVLDEAGGIFTVELIPANTSSLPARVNKLVYDVKFVNSSADVYTLSEGQLEVRPNVS